MEIKDKIKKLLSLAESPNENEAKAAMLKAKELMAKHKLEEGDFKEEAELIHMEVEDVSWTTDSGDIWMVELCKVISENYRCTASWRHTKGCRTYTLMITGFEEDAKVCVEVIGYAVGFIANAVKTLRYKRPDQDMKAVKQSYAQGFILGLEIAYEMQKEEHPEWGLVVVKPKEVKEYEDSLDNRDVKTNKAEFDLLAYMKGQNDGSNFNAGNILQAVGE